MRRVFVVAATTFVLGMTSGAGAQCLLDLDSLIGNGGLSGTEVRTQPIVTTGTFECGITRGTTCSTGTITGTCSSSTLATESLSCEGECAVEPDGSLTCEGNEVSRSTVSADCLAGSCVVTGSGHGTDPFTGGSFVGVTVGDPAGLSESVAECANGSASSTHSYGAIVVTP